MRPTLPRLAPAAALTLGLALGLPLSLYTAPATAQTAAVKPAPAKPAARKAAPVKPVRATKARAKAGPPPLPAASGEQLAAAALAHFGTYACEFAQTVEVTLDAKNEGYVGVRFGKQAWVMKPVLSSTGALRLEDVKGRTMMLQIANKSMLMDTKLGRRLVDECLHDSQRQFNTERAAEAARADAAAKAAPAASAPQ